MEKHEIRQNKATKEWVIYSPARDKRPSDFKREKKKNKLPETDPHCPFCIGNESEINSIVLEMPSANNSSWQTRVIPNKYPALTREGEQERISSGFFVSMKGYGIHEVIIESPRHNSDIALMSSEELNILIETYHRRYTDAMKERRNMMPIIFRNHGEHAGTSLLHPHSQLIITGFVPHHVRWREIEAQRYYDEWGRCVFCDMLRLEKIDGKRILFESEYMTAFIPYAAEVPFEIWIMPKIHRSDFGKIIDTEKNSLAKALKFVLGKLFNKLNDPDYNYIINTAARYETGKPHLHWYLQIRPRLTTRAGFEIGSGISINPTIPEENVKFLFEKD